MKLRLGFNRIHIVFAADNMLNAATYGIDSGVTAAIGLPQMYGLGRSSNSEASVVSRKAVATIPWSYRTP